MVFKGAHSERRSLLLLTMGGAGGPVLAATVSKAGGSGTLALWRVSAKLLTGTKHPFSGLSNPRQCGEDVLRMLVTGAPPNAGGGGIPIVSSLSLSVLRITGAVNARHRRLGWRRSG